MVRNQYINLKFNPRRDAASLRSPPRGSASIDCCLSDVVGSAAPHPLSGMAPTLNLVKYLLMHHYKRLLAAAASSLGWRLSAASAPILQRPAIFHFSFQSLNFLTTLFMATARGIGAGKHAGARLVRRNRN